MSTDLTPPVQYRGTVPLVRAASGRLVPFLPDNDGHEGDPPAAPPANDPPAAPPAAETVTKAELDRQVAKAAKDAAAATKKELDEFLSGQKAEADKAKMDEAGRAKAEADEARAAAAADRAAAARERLDAKVERKLTAAGVGKDLKSEEATKALARAMRAVNLPDDADDDAITAEIEALQKEVPGLFVAAPAGAAGGAPSGVTGGTKPPAGAPAGGDPLAKGRERAKATAASRTGATKDDLLAAFAPKSSPFAQSH